MQDQQGKDEEQGKVEDTFCGNDSEAEAAMILPPVFPPDPSKQTNMVIEFNYRLKEFVKIKNTNLSGVIIAAGVAFEVNAIIYLVETGGTREKWYPETMLSPMHMYDIKSPGPVIKATDTTINKEGKSDGHETNRRD